MMASILARGNRDGRSLILKGVDPETCMIVFKNHWAQVVKILEKHDPLRSGRGRLGSTGAGSGLHFGPIPGDEASAVQNYVEHMLFLLMEEGCGQAGAMGPILEFVVMENVMEKLFLWSLRREFTDDMKLEQLRMYEMLVGQSRQPLLHHKPVLRPLMMLLSSCSGANAPAVEAELVLLLNQLCSILAKDPSVLELFFHTSEDQGATNFLIFSLLIPFIHREGVVGRQARDALLYIMALSAENHVVAEHIVENTYFCPVLATGLSGLYSSLPTKLEVPGEDWYCLEREDWLLVPTLVQFLHSLEFCNAVIQVAHPSIRSQLVSYIYNGFLVPVLAPALHKLTLEEVMTTTAYLDLFLRSVSEPALLQTFLSFVLLHQHENVYILDTLVSRINTPFQLGTVSLALFRTLIGLYCEDVMLQLVLRYLLPCTHMMLSQRRVLRERDCYSVSAARLLALTPTCCRSLLSPLHAQPPDCFLWSEGTDGSHAGNTDEVHSGYTCIMGPEVFLDISYVHYLHDAHSGISSCIKACRVWSAPYDGNNPPSEHCQLWGLEEVGRPTTLTQAKRTLRTTHPPDPGPRENRVNLLELEWDDSYDAVPSPGDCDGDVFEEKGPPTPAEPPKHIQEMRKNAIMLIKGSYIEESDFQDDVMVYDLVAEKDTKDHSLTDPLQTEPAAPGLGLDSDQNPEEAAQPLSNGVGFTQQQGGKRHSCGLLLANPSPPGDDLLSEYEELIRSLGVESGSPVKPEKDLRNPLGPAEEEDVMDFTSFAGAPEPENTPSPFGPKPRSGSRSQGAPFTGPFISVLLSRLENMLENSLHVNLLLTGILAQLATYPQPLLCSFLLNTNMVFQPNVRSLYQVLASVRNQIEQRAAARSDFPELLKEAQWYLLAREYALRTQDSHSEKNGDWLPNGEEKSAQTITDRVVKGLPPHPKIPPQARDCVFATVLFTEFLKELAAVAQEHSILSHLSMED